MKAASESPTWNDLLESAHAWMLVPEEVPPDDLQRCCSVWLSPEERKNMARLRKASLRHDYLAARALCRRVISQSTGIEPAELVFYRSPCGKPLLAGPSPVRSLEFNLTHTEGLLVCLLSRAGAVGVDAEDMSVRWKFSRSPGIFSHPQRAIRSSRFRRGSGSIVFMSFGF
jgi:phosphopantetheinyl transferase